MIFMMAFAFIVVAVIVAGNVIDGEKDDSVSERDPFQDDEVAIHGYGSNIGCGIYSTTWNDDSSTWDD